MTSTLATPGALSAWAHHASLDFILKRRSATKLEGPEPTPVELDAILRAAGTVPDHGLMRPYRFVVVKGEGRTRFGHALAEVAKAERPDLPEGKLEKMRQKPFRSPMSIVVIASMREGKAEAWEQIASASCAGYAITLAAHALGLGAVWKSVPFTSGDALSEALGMREGELMLGWIHLGHHAKGEAPEPRVPLDLATHVSVLEGNACTTYQGPRPT